MKYAVVFSIIGVFPTLAEDLGQILDPDTQILEHTACWTDVFHIGIQP